MFRIDSFACVIDLFAPNSDNNSKVEDLIVTLRLFKDYCSLRVQR